MDPQKATEFDSPDAPTCAQEIAEIEQAYSNAIEAAFDVGFSSHEKESPFMPTALVNAWELGRKMGQQRKR